MDYKQLLEQIKDFLSSCEKMRYGEYVGAPWPYNHDGPMVYTDPDAVLLDLAATAITDLLARAEAEETELAALRRLQPVQLYDAGANALALAAEVSELRQKLEAEEARAEKAERERDAAIKELDGVAAAVDDLSDFIDEQIHPLIQYDMYLALRENADAISMWQYESEWRRGQGNGNEKDSSV